MSRATVGLLLLATVLMVVPAQAEFWSLSDLDLVYTKDSSVTPPNYWLEGFTFPDYDIPLENLVVGTTTGVVNVNAQKYSFDMVDDFELNDTFAPRNGANPPEFQTVNFGGSPTWQDTNGADKFDFFVFEAGANDEFAVQAILPGGVLGQKVVVPASKWKDTGSEPLPDLKKSGGDNNNQQIAGIAFKITDLLDADGNPLPNDTVIEGLQFTSPGMDPSCICAVRGAPQASGPDPADGATVETTCFLLKWSQGMGATSEDVYLSTSRDEVEGMAAAAVLTGVTQPVASVCTPGSRYASGLAPGTYYWRIVTNPGQGQIVGPLWSFLVISGTAFDPMPVEAAIYVSADAGLSWSAGADAIIHYVVIGTDRDLVAGAAEGSGSPTTQPTFDPPTLDKGTTYYWRVDEFDGTNTTKGEVWSFSTVPAGEGGLKAEYFTGEEPLTGQPAVARVDAQVDFNWNQEPPEASIDRLLFSARWQGEITIPADGTYTFITRSNDGSRIYVNDQLVVEDWGTHVVRDDMGTIALKAGSYPIAVEYFQQGGSAEMHILWQSNLIGRQIIPSVVLAPVVRARLVYPADKRANINQTPNLRWETVAPAATHLVFLGEDAALVAQADQTTTGIFKGEQEGTSYPASLEPGMTYYWRIDEVIAGDPQSPIQGNVWSFTTATDVVVDDFENYTDDLTNRIFQTWLDGFGYTEPVDTPGNGTGSIVGNAEPPFAEQTIVHAGGQSLSMEYLNDETPFYSETERTFATPQNWTSAFGRDLKSLALWFRGVAPLGDFSYDATKGQYTIVGSGDGVDDTSDGFRFVYKKLSGNGSITARLVSMGRPQDWATASLMFRNSLEPGSVMVTCGVRATGQAFLRWRLFANDDLAGTVEEPAFPATIVIPHYLKLTRTGSVFIAQHSSDGKNWENVGESVTLAVGTDMYIGLAVSSDTPDAQAAVNQAVFSDVSTIGSVSASGPFQNVKDIGIGGNTPQSLYVAVQDSSGTTAVVPHPDGPQAVVTNAWTNWTIDLDDFAGRGANLAAVRKLIIGVGDRDHPVADGGGMLYVDDIRLLDAIQAPPVITVSAAASIETTGDDGAVLSINGIDVGQLVLATTSTDFEKFVDHPAAHADDFDMGTYASLDDSSFIRMAFATPVTTIFIIERGGNDQGFIQPFGADGNPVGGPQAFATSDWYKPGAKINSQTAGTIVIESVVPISGITILPPEGGVVGLDPASVSGVPAQ